MPRPHPYEQWILRNYLRNLMRLPYRQNFARLLTSAMEGAARVLALQELPDTNGADLDDWLVHEKPRDRWRQIVRAVEGSLAKAEPAKSPLADNLAQLGALLGLDELEQRILGACVRYKTDKATENILDVYKRTESPDSGMLAMLLGVSQTAVARRLTSTSPLGQTIMPDRLRIRQDDVFDRVPSKVCTLLTERRKKRSELELSLARPAPKTDLLWTGYDHLAGDRDLAARILRGALERGEKGINLLFYGPPGTGKTALAQVLSREVGARVIAVGEEDEQGDEPSRSERLAALHAAGAVARHHKNTVVLFDDMDDLLDRSGSSMHLGGSRVFMHRVLENNLTPTIWTANCAGGFDQAVLRRMTFAMEIRVPPTSVRTRVLSRVLKKHKLPLPDAVIERMAREYPVAPALAENAARAAAIAGGSLDDARRVLECSARLATGRANQELRPGDEKCSLDLLRTSIDLAALTKRLVSARARAFSVCLSGPPGTGKSSYARHLAGALGMEVLQKRTSDLISPFVGGSEKNIAGAFREAIETNAILVFDEADSLLRDRSGARNSWEDTQVNEMLTWMESHLLPFICTTNLMESVDHAALRRFTYKVELDYLDRVRNAHAFQLYFGSDAPDRVLSLKVLTPGDFAVVARRVQLEGCEGQADLIASMLEHECLAKKGTAREIGFGR